MKQAALALVRFTALGCALFAGATVVRAQAPAAPFVEEWVYKVKLGHQDEFWTIFKKYQIATLNKEKELGGVLKYEVFRPGLHTSEDHRWDFRIVIYYKDQSAPSAASAIEKQLFPDQATLKREEQRRWELTEVHWDLPIRQVDPNAN
ncbi:MAG: hypothetical protein ABL967_16475 [Bryobacteraceae bacterium]